MSRHQPTLALSVLLLFCLIVGFLLISQPRDGAVIAQTPPPPAAGANPFALIKTIVVRGAETEKVSSSDVAIDRGGSITGAEAGMILYVGDHVTTGSEVKLTLLFLDNAAERDNEVVLDAMTHVQLGSLFSWAGRILARVKDKFQTKTTRAQWSVVGTEYELAVLADGTNVLRVLKGSVRSDAGTFRPIAANNPQQEIPQNPVWFQNAAFREPEAGAQEGPMEFVARSGKVIDVEREFILTNSCRRPHVYKVMSPLNLSWFQFLGADQFEIPGGGTRNIKFVIRLDATNVPAGRQDSQITFPCLDCNTEPDCRIGGLLLPITMRVLDGGPSPIPPPPPPPPAQTSMVATRMQEIILPPAGYLNKSDLSAQQVDQTLNWSNPVIIAGEPSYSTQSVAPNFANWNERNNVFREARRSSIINDDRHSKEILADVYVDWGNGAKAEEELKYLGLTTQETPERLTTLGEAYRLMGDLQQAEQYLQRAVSLDPNWRPALNALGNVYLDQAKLEEDRKNYGSARGFLEKANAQYAKALQARSTLRQNHATQTSRTAPAGNRTESVVQSNLGEVHLRLGAIAQAVGDNSSALRELQVAEQSFGNAVRTDQSYQFAFKGLGDVYRETGEAHGAMGNPSMANQYFARSQDQYTQALRLHNDMAEAYVGLGQVLDDMGRREEALQHYFKATRVRPELPDPHYHLAVALSEKDPIRAAEQARVYLKIERPPLTQGEKSRVAEDVSAGKRIRIATPTPPTGATPPREDLATPTPPDVVTPPPRPPVRVPSMRGDQPGKALDELRSLGLVGQLRNLRDCEATGKVLSTEPGSRAMVPYGSTVIVNVSSAGENGVIMPGLKGISQRDAEAELNRLGLNPSSRTRETDRANPYTVIDQDPDAGKALPSGCPVKLTIAIPIPPVSVPNFVGQSVQSVYLAGLSLGSVSEVESDQSGGTILSQSLSPGQLVPRGTSINFQVAASMVFVPDLMNRSQAQAEAMLKQAGLRSAYQTQPTQNSFVSKQDPVTGTRVRRGSVVRLWFSVID